MMVWIASDVKNYFGHSKTYGQEPRLLFLSLSDRKVSDAPCQRGGPACPLFPQSGFIQSFWISGERWRSGEESLEEKMEELDQFFNISLDLLCVANMDGYFLHLNPSWERSLGQAMPAYKDGEYVPLSSEGGISVSHRQRHKR